MENLFIAIKLGELCNLWIFVDQFTFKEYKIAKSNFWIILETQGIVLPWSCDISAWDGKISIISLLIFCHTLAVMSFVFNCLCMNLFEMINYPEWKCIDKILGLSCIVRFCCFSIVILNKRVITNAWIGYIYIFDISLPVVVHVAIIIGYCVTTLHFSLLFVYIMYYK